MINEKPNDRKIRNPKGKSLGPNKLKVKKKEGHNTKVPNLK